MLAYCLNKTSRCDVSIDNGMEELKNIYINPDEYINTKNKNPDDINRLLLKIMQKGIGFVFFNFVINEKHTDQFYWNLLEIINNKISYRNITLTGASLLDHKWFLDFLKVVIENGNPPREFYQQLIMKMMMYNTYQIPKELQKLILLVLEKNPDMSKYKCHDFGRKYMGFVHHLIWKFDHDFLKQVLEYKTKCNIGLEEENSEGDTPLLMACRLGLSEAAGVLIGHGIKIGKKTREGSTILDLLNKTHKTYQFPTWGNSDNTKIMGVVKDKISPKHINE